jgi:hypothetical protein
MAAAKELQTHEGDTSGGAKPVELKTVVIRDWPIEERRALVDLHRSTLEKHTSQTPVGGKPGR